MMLIKLNDEEVRIALANALQEKIISISGCPTFETIRDDGAFEIVDADSGKIIDYQSVSFYIEF